MIFSGEVAAHDVRIADLEALKNQAEVDDPEGKTTFSYQNVQLALPLHTWWYSCYWCVLVRMRVCVHLHVRACICLTLLCVMLTLN